MTQLFTIQEDRIVIDNLELNKTQGEVTHDGHIDVTGNVSIGFNLKVNGTITADTFNVKNLITENGGLAGVGDWTYNTEEELNGKGFSWTWGDGNVRLAYRTGKRLWANADLDLETNRAFKIDNVAVLSAKELGGSVIKSNLREVGPLKSLRVVGDTTLSEFAVFSSSYNRLGLGTDEPNMTISIVENDIEIGIGSPKQGLAVFGAYSNHDAAIMADGIPRLTVKNNGEVHIGDEVSKDAVLRVFGVLHAETVVSDTRIDRSTPLEFKADRDSSIYGKGLIWTGAGATRELVMSAGPDRIRSSESFDVASGQCYYVGGKAVLTADSLGEAVTKSHLTSLGNLNSLTVQGKSTLYGDIEASGSSFAVKSIAINDGANSLNINNTSVNANNSISITAKNSEVFYADENEIVIGNKSQTRKPVKVFGPVAIGINNPDPDVSFSVSGNVSFANKKFTNGTSIPTTGTHTKGDIIWNQDPKASSYIGWVCVDSGAPGQWLPFGAIGRQ